MKTLILNPKMTAATQPTTARERRKGLATALLKSRPDQLAKGGLEGERSINALREIAESLSDGLFVREPDGSISYANAAFESLWGSSAATRPAALTENGAAIHEEDRARISRAEQLALTKGTPFDEQYRLRRADGSIRWLNERRFPIGGEHAGRFAGIVRDVTGDRELDQERAHAQKMQAVGLLASGISHDFRNVLHGIMNWMTLAMAEEGSSERTRAYLQRAQGVARKGSALVERLLLFSRNDEPRPRAIDLDSVVRDSVTLLEPILGKDIQLQVETGADEGSIVADPTQIEQLLLNLVTNARDAMPTGGMIKVRTSSCESDAPPMGWGPGGRPRRWVRLSVIDTGTGITDSLRREMFKPFFTTKRLGRGTGLGLAIVKAIVDALSGTIDVQSTPGSGTTFTLTIPACDHPLEHGVKEHDAEPAGLDGEDRFARIGSC